MPLPTNLPWDMADNKWANELNPLLSLPILNGIMLMNIKLKAGDNQINHLLGHKQVGWFITDKTDATLIYRSKPFNDLILTLNSSAPTVVSLWVF